MHTCSLPPVVAYSKTQLFGEPEPYIVEKAFAVGSTDVNSVEEKKKAMEHAYSSLQAGRISAVRMAKMYMKTDLPEDVVAKQQELGTLSPDLIPLNAYLRDAIDRLVHIDPVFAQPTPPRF